MIESHAQSKSQPAVHFPVVLRISLHVPVDDVEARGHILLAVTGDIAEQGIGETVIRVEQRNRGRGGKTEGARIVWIIGALKLYVLFKIESKFERVTARNLAEVVRKVPGGVDRYLLPGRSALAIVGHGIGGCAAEAEGGEDVVVTVDSALSAIVLGGRHWKERRQAGHQRTVFSLIVIRRDIVIHVPIYGDRGLVDQCRRDGVRKGTQVALPAVRMVDGGNSLLTQNAPHVGSELDPIVQGDRGVVILHPTEGGVEFRRYIAIDTEHVVAPRVAAAGLLEVVHDVHLSGQHRSIVWRREEVEQRLAHRIEARRGYDVAGKLQVVVGRIEDLDLTAVVIKALREVAHALQLRGRVHALRAAAYELAGILLRPEEEQSRLVRVEMLRDEHGTAYGVSLDVIPVWYSGRGNAILNGVVVHPGVRVELLVPVVPRRGAMELLCSAFSHDGDHSARVAPEFGGVIGSQDLQLLDRVEVRLNLKRSRRSRIHVGDSVD